MKNIKDIVIGLFAVIGFTAIVTGFTKDEVNGINQEIQQAPSILASPQSHVWEVIPVGMQAGFLLNKETGELKALNWKTGWNGVKMSDAELDN